MQADKPDNPALAALRRACSKGEPILEEPTPETLALRARNFRALQADKLRELEQAREVVLDCERSLTMRWSFDTRNLRDARERVRLLEEQAEALASEARKLEPGGGRCRACGAFRTVNVRTGRLHCPATEAHKVLRGR